MKKQIISWGVVIVLIVGGFWAYQYATKITMPIVGQDGKINGSYSIESIMALDKPYKCTFEKADGVSKILGIIHTAGQKIYGEFRIKTDSVKNEFSSFLIVKEGETYTWTSLALLGYKSSVAKSSSINATPTEQAQIIGTKDKVLYKCEPWTEVDQSLFEIPSWVTFSELNK